MAMNSSPRNTSFRLLGFPIKLRLGFFFVILFVLGRSGTFDLKYAVGSVVAYAGFMIIHELGHAVAARRYGCTDVAISLDFLIGYAMFRPPTDITKKRLALISAAGPAAEIVTGLAVLLAMGADLTSFDSMRVGLRGVVLWFGPVLGAANLIPILPLDGGNIVALGFEKLHPRQGRRLFQKVSLGLSIAIVVYALSNARTNGWSPFLLPGIMLTMMNLTGMRAGPGATTAPPAQASAVIGDTATAAARAEDEAWRATDPGAFPAGTGPSPWVKAHHAFKRGDIGSARWALQQSVLSPTGYWQLSDTAPHEALLPLVDLVPDPVPVDDLHGARTYHHVLHRLGFLRRGAEYGARVYDRHRDSFTAHQVSIELALLGHGDHAMSWLKTALADPLERERLGDPGLDSLRNRPDWVGSGAPPR